MKKVLITVLFLFATILPTFAANWAQLGEKSWLDVTSIEQYRDDGGCLVSDQYSFWVKYLNDGSSIFKQLEKYFNVKVWYLLIKHVIDIDKKMIACKTFIVCDIKGSVVDVAEMNGDLFEWGPIAPDTCAELEYKAILLKRVIENDINR